MHKQTMNQCCVIVPNETGMLAKVTQLLAREGINIDSLMTESVGDLAAILSVVGLSRLVSPSRRCGGRAFHSVFFLASLVTLVLSQTRAAVVGFLVAALLMPVTIVCTSILLALGWVQPSHLWQLLSHPLPLSRET